MKTEFNYFKIHRNNDDQIPLLDEDDDCPNYLYKKEPIKNPELLTFKLGEPIPRKPKMADYHASPDSIISKKIFDVLSELNINNIQLLPAQIEGKKNELFNEYWAIHAYNRIKCIDMKLSDCELDDFGINSVTKIILDEKILSKIPLNKRLIFRLGEDRSYILFHSSVVDEILKVNPTGVKFTNINDWNDGSLFEN